MLGIAGAGMGPAGMQQDGPGGGLSISVPGAAGNPALNPFSGQPLVSPGLMAMADAAEASHRAASHAFAGAFQPSLPFAPILSLHVP